MADTNLATYRNKDKEVAVVFIHGFMGDVKKTWGKFPELLAADTRIKEWDIYSLGYPSNFLFDLVGIWKANPDISTVAATLRTTALLPLSGYRSLALVAHSMGGLAVRRALVDDDQFAARVGHVFLFGTPSNGLVKASFFKFWKQQLDNMAEGGDFITELRQSWRKKFVERSPGFKFWAVAGDQDEFVSRRSSIEPFDEKLRFVIPGDHLSIAKPVTPENLGVQLVLNGLVGKAAAAGPGNSARVAIEEREFYQAITLLEPHLDTLDEPSLVQLALAYESVGRQAEAITLLERRRPKYTDAVGVLAGRLKRRWLIERQSEDAELARELYAQALEAAVRAEDWPQAFYHGINVAFMLLAYGDRPELDFVHF